jgi:hypothetical protein
MLGRVALFVTDHEPAGACGSTSTRHVATAEATSWPGLAAQLAQLGWWEFEGYQVSHHP